jgi:2-oxoisovalerate dehydrogenase E1 component
MPSNAQDALGFQKRPRQQHPIFFEHRSFNRSAQRRPYPGDDFVVPFGAGLLREGTMLTVVTWGPWWALRTGY